MNNQTLQVKTNAFHSRLINTLLSHLYALTTILIFTSTTFAQAATWRYVSTLPGGIKSYLNDEVKVLPNKNKVRWEKMIKSDDSSATALVEWNCAAKLRLTKQRTFYNTDQSVIGTKKNGFDWTPLIPGSSADFLYRRVCTAMTFQTAEITSANADLRTFPDNSAPITRTAKRGDKFQIVPESGQGGWFNIVDAATQEDYWLRSNSFKIIEPPAAKTKTADKVKNSSLKSQKLKNQARQKRRGN